MRIPHLLSLLANRLRGGGHGSQTNASDAVDDIELRPDASPEEMLDAGVKQTFPASDPPAVQDAAQSAYEKNLRGFERVLLKAGETKTVHFVIPSEGLSLLNRDMKRVVEPGEFKVMVGASSEDIRLEGTFVVQ